MLNGLRHRWKLNQLYEKQRRHSKEYRILLRKAEKEKQSPKDIEFLKAEDYASYREYEEEINLLVTRNLLRKAKNLMLPIPSISDEGMWEECQFNLGHFLTNKGISQIRGLIRRERKEKMDLYIPWITALIGIVGAVTGLMAVILK